MTNGWMSKQLSWTCFGGMCVNSSKCDSNECLWFEYYEMKNPNRTTLFLIPDDGSDEKNNFPPKDLKWQVSGSSKADRQR